MLKKFTERQRQLWIIIHLLFSSIYFSGLLVTLLLTLSTTITVNPELIYPAHLFAKYSDWYLIIPGALGTLLTGIWLSLRTTWGLTKYLWVIAKIAGNIGTIMFGSLCMRMCFAQIVALSSTGNSSFLNDPVYLHNRQILIIGTLISVAIVTFLVVISVTKPWGRRV